MDTSALFDLLLQLALGPLLQLFALIQSLFGTGA